MQLRSATRDNLGNLGRCPPASCIYGDGTDRGPEALPVPCRPMPPRSSVRLDPGGTRIQTGASCRI